MVPRQLGRAANLVAHDPGQRRLGRALGRHGPGPEGDQRFQTQLAAERKPIRIRPERRLDVGKVRALRVRR